MAETVLGEPKPGEVEYFLSGTKPGFRFVSKAAPSSTFTCIPTIDLADIDHPDVNVRRRLANETYKACTDCGFFYIKNHGISDELQRDTLAALHRFFALESSKKMEAHVQKNPAIRGYEPMGETRNDPRTRMGRLPLSCQADTLDYKEAFTMGDCYLEPEQRFTERTGRAPPANVTKPQNIWPSEIPWFREALYRYYWAVLPLSLKLVRLFALALLDDEGALEHMFSFPITGMRPLHYPPMPPASDEHSISLGAHSDYDCWYLLCYSANFTDLTLVLQDSVPALEALNADGVWIRADPKPGEIVCNVGQLLERQTNGKFLATVHRVRNMTGERRYSLPFFLAPDVDASISVLKACLSDGEEPKFDAINMGDFYIRGVLPARPKHPTSIKYRNTPEDEWSYDMLLS